MRWLVFLFCMIPALAWGQGKGFVANTLEENLSGPGRTVTVTGFSGALSSQAKMQEMTVADGKGVWLTLKGVTLDWSRAALLTGRIQVNELSADEIDVARLPESPPAQAPSPEAGGFSLPELPVSVNIGKIAAKRVSLGAPVLGQAAVLTVSGSLKLAGGDGGAKLEIRRIDGPAGEISLDASYSNSSRTLALDLQTKEAAKGLIATLIGLPGAPALELSVKGQGPIDDYAADIALSTDGKPRLTGQVSLRAPKSADGTAQGRIFSAALAGDIAPLFAPAYRDFFGKDIHLSIDGTQAGDGTLTLSKLNLSAQAIRLGGQMTLGPDGLPRLIDLQGRIGTAGGPPVLLPLTGAATRIGGATLAVSFDAAKGKSWQGKVVLDGLHRADLSADRLALEGTGSIDVAAKSVDGTMRIDGQGLKPGDPAIASALGQALSGRVRFAWAQGGALELPEVALLGAGIDLTASGRIEGLNAALTVAGKADAKVADLSRFAGLAGRSLGGTGDVRIEGTAALMAGSFDLAATVNGQDLRAGQPQIDALLQGRSTVAVSVKRDETGTQLKKLTVSAATLTASASGEIKTGASDISADLTFSDLSVLGPSYAGALSARAHYSEADGAGHLSLNGTGTDLTIGQPQADGLLKGRTVLAVKAVRRGAAVTLEQVRITNPQLAADAKGVVEAGASDVAASLDFSDLSALGKAYGRTLSARAHLTQKNGVDRVTLDGTATNLSLGQPEADRLLQGKTVLSAAASRQAGLLTLDRLSLANPQLTAEAKSTEPGAAEQKLAVSAKFADLALVAPGFPGPLTLSGTVSESASGYGLDLKTAGPGGLSAVVSGSVSADFSKAEVTAKGNVEAGIINGLIEPRSISGPARFDLRLAGPPRLSSLNGTVHVGPARLSAPTLGVVADPLDAAVTLGNGQAQLRARANIGGGTVTLDGPVTLAAPFPATFTAKLAHVLFKNPDLFSTHVDGSLTVNGPLAGGASIAGALRLGQTEVRVPSTGLGGSGSIPDLKLVGATPSETATRARAGLGLKQTAQAQSRARPFGLDITISAPNQVFIRGRGLDAELGGQVKLGGTSANVIPSGGFRLLRGRLDLLGKRFDLSEATLELQGRFVPYVQILANSVNDGITSTISIAGEATDPKITFSSSPPLPQEEVLSQLLFGRGLSKISPLQAAQLASAVATLAGKGGEGIIGKLRQNFGLDNLDLQSTDTGGTQVKAGKYLSRNLYTEVTVGSEGKSAISLNLDVTKSVTVKGTAGSDGSTGIGIYYQRDF